MESPPSRPRLLLPFSLLRASSSCPARDNRPSSSRFLSPSLGHYLPRLCDVALGCSKLFFAVVAKPFCWHACSLGAPNIEHSSGRGFIGGDTYVQGKKQSRTETGPGVP
jgi:hypothetical protein